MAEVHNPHPNDFEESDIRTALTAFRDSASRQTDRPGWFWTRQHARVMSQIREEQNCRLPRRAWAYLAATIAIAVALILPANRQNPAQPQAAVQPQVELSDHDLMLAVERTLNDGGPSSLTPASILAEEMNQALVSQVQSQKAKENRYEN